MRLRHKPGAESPKVIWACLASALVIYGVSLRYHQIGVAPFWIDEAFSIESINQAWNLDSYHWLRAWLYHQVLGLSTGSFGESTTSTRLPSLLASMLGVLSIGLICLRRFGRLPALVAIAIMALGYWHIAWARQAREYAFLMGAFWFSIALYDRYLIENRGNNFTRSAKATLVITTTLICGLIHPFGLLSLPAAVLALSIENKKYRVGIVGSCMAVVFGTVLITSLYPIKNALNAIYGPFLIEQYCALMIVGLPSIGLIKQHTHRWFLVWLWTFCLAGLLAISFLVPMVNLRYLYFLTPVFAVLAAASVFVLAKPFAIIWAAVSMAILSLSNQLVLNPQKAYPLESFKTSSGFHYYTPQPKFDVAYQYINNRLKKKDLVTPYPAISRRYRDVPDTLALDAKVSFRGDSTAGQKFATEHYTRTVFADGRMLLQLAKQEGEVYVLIDQMGLQRLAPLTKTVILEQSTLVRKWQKRPFSSLFLYKIAADD